MSGNLFVNIEVYPGFSIRSSINTFYNRDDRVYYEHTNNNLAPNVKRQGRMRSWMDRVLNYTWENLLIYNQHWDESHQIEDRKSTRLNSSHVASSYAVFSLKKKKKRAT